MKFLVKNWFLIGLLLLLTVGFLAPDIGIGISAGSVTTNILIVLIFLITGYTLPSEAVKNGLREIKLHLFLQIFIFAVVPLYFYLTLLLIPFQFSAETRIGIFALAVLPTTIFSCVLFTQTSGGNTVGAMFNAALANLLGIFISPFLLSLLIKSSGELDASEEILSVVISIGLKILLPLTAGQILHKSWKSGLKHKKKLSILSNIGLLLIVFINFSKSAADPDFRSMLPAMAAPFLYLAVSFVLLLGLSFLSASAFGFSRSNIITILFTAPQKTLAMGVPLLSTFFVNSPELLGAALLPLLFYHPWQLFVSGFLKSFLRNLDRSAAQNLSK